MRTEDLLEMIDLMFERENQADCRTFERAGLMTSNEGLVVKFADGSEFQITIVQSRDAVRS